MKLFFLLMTGCASYSIKKTMNIHDLSFLDQAHDIKTKTEKILQEIYSQDISKESLKLLDETLEDFSSQMNYAYFLKSVHDDKKIREKGLVFEQDLFKFYVEKIQTKQFYDFFLRASQVQNLDLTTQRYVQESKKSLEERGLHLNNYPDIQTISLTIKDLSDKLDQGLAQSNTLTHKLQDDTGLPPHLKEKNKTGLNPAFMTDTQGVMDFAQNQKERKAFYLAANKRGMSNKDNFILFLKEQQKYAQALGHENYTAYNLKNNMAKNPENVIEQQDKIFNQLKEKFQQELNALKKEFNLSDINIWDIAYYKRLYNEKHYQVDPLEIRKYFEMKTSLEGMLKIFSQLFNYRYEFKEIKSSWTTDLVYEVKFYDQDENGLFLGSLYLDLFPRPANEKYGHFAQFTLKHSRRNQQEHSPAYCAIVGNFQRSSENEPSLLSFDQVNTLFHELGHALHTLFSKTQYYALSGTQVKRDFVEVPSQLLERWLQNYDLVKSFAIHYKTKEVLSEDLFNKLHKSLNFLKSFKYLKQIKMAEADLKLFQGKGANDPQKLFQDLNNEVLPVKEKDLTTLYTFGHLFGGYSAAYYSYLWSEIIVEALHERFKDNYLDSNMGKKLKETIFSQGNNEDPNDLVNNFLDEEYTVNAFIQSLNKRD